MARLFGTFLPASECVFLCLSQSVSHSRDVIKGIVYIASFLRFVKMCQSDQSVARENSNLFPLRGRDCFNDTFIIIYACSRQVFSPRLFPIFSQIAVVFTIDHDSQFLSSTLENFNFRFRTIQLKLCVLTIQIKILIKSIFLFIKFTFVRNSLNRLKKVGLKKMHRRRQGISKKNYLFSFLA